MKKIKLKDKKIKKDLTQPERHFGVLLESMDSKIDILVDGHQALNKKIDKNHQEFQEFREEANFKFKIITETLNSHTETLNSHTEMIGKLATDMEVIKSDGEIIKSGLRKKVDWEDFEALEKRVFLLEKTRK